MTGPGQDRGWEGGSRGPESGVGRGWKKGLATWGTWEIWEIWEIWKYVNEAHSQKIAHRPEMIAHDSVLDAERYVITRARPLRSVTTSKEKLGLMMKHVDTWKSVGLKIEKCKDL